MTTEIRKGGLVELDVESVAFGGKGIARSGGMVVFVDGALPGDRLVARVTRRKPQFAEAVIDRVVTPSPWRIDPLCPVFGVCGGCRWQNFTYEQQIEAKRQHVADALKHIGKMTDFEIRPILPSPSTWAYRNKMEYSFGADETGRIIIGFHKSGDFRTIVESGPVCEIQPPGMKETLDWMTQRLNQERDSEGEGFVPYNQSRHKGFLRHLVLRYSAAHGHFLVAILTASGKWNGVERFTSDLMEAFPACRGFQWGTTDSLSDVARMEALKFSAGESAIEERLGDLRFRVSMFSFFQTNTAGAKILYDAVRELAGLTGREHVLDAYCGAGSIGIYLARDAASVLGIELVTEAVWDARCNAELNNLDNCLFLAGEMRETLPRVPALTGNSRFDCVVVDPPRGGMDKKSLRLITGIQAPVLVYVSCNPATLARDGAVLAGAGYVPEIVQPVDMFPHTWHVESVIRFRRQAS